VNNQDETVNFQKSPKDIVKEIKDKLVTTLEAEGSAKYRTVRMHTVAKYEIFGFKPKQINKLVKKAVNELIKENPNDYFIERRGMTTWIIKTMPEKVSAPGEFRELSELLHNIVSHTSANREAEVSSFLKQIDKYLTLVQLVWDISQPDGNFGDDEFTERVGSSNNLFDLAGKGFVRIKSGGKNELNKKIVEHLKEEE